MLTHHSKYFFGGQIDSLQNLAFKTIFQIINMGNPPPRDSPNNECIIKANAQTTFGFGVCIGNGASTKHTASHTGTILVLTFNLINSLAK